MPCTWKTDLAMSRPIVMIACMDSSSKSRELNQLPLPWHSRAGWRSRPQHQKRTSRRFGTMSAIPPRADKLGGRPFVRKVPIVDVALFNYLVGAGEQRRRDFEAKRFCCFEVDHQLKLVWLLHRQITWLLSL